MGERRTEEDRGRRQEEKNKKKEQRRADEVEGSGGYTEETRRGKDRREVRSQRTRRRN